MSIIHFHSELDLINDLTEMNVNEEQILTVLQEKLDLTEYQRVKSIFDDKNRLLSKLVLKVTHEDREILQS